MKPFLFYRMDSGRGISPPRMDYGAMGILSPPRIMNSPPRGEYGGTGSAGGSSYYQQQHPPRASRSPPRRSNSPGLGTFLNLKPKPSERVNSDLEKYWRDQMSNISKGPVPPPSTSTSRPMPGINN